MKKNENIKHIWSMLCQESSIDSTTNNLSLFKILEQVQFDIDMNKVDESKIDPNKSLVLAFKFNLVTLWKNDKSKDNYSFFSRIIIKDPNEKVLSTTDKELFFTDGKKRLRNITTFDGVMVTESGEYTYSIMLKDSNNNYKEVATLPLDIKINLNR